MMRCRNCGANNPQDKKFCGDCGRALSEGGATLAADPAAGPVAAALQNERKTVTALFADIKGSMELLEDLDPDDARAIIDPSLKLMIDAVHQYDGYVVQSTGDGVFAIFGAPVAREDHPQRALYAALKMRDDLRRYCEKLEFEGRQRITVRIGVNTGEAVVRTIHTSKEQPEYTPIGHATSVAARMQSLAPPGSIAVTEETGRLVEGYFEFKDIGPTRVKGVSHPVRVLEVLGPGKLRTRFEAAARRGLVRFVGRVREIETLHRALDRSLQGRGQVVAVVAEAGAGKSRLFFEFRRSIDPRCLVLETFSVSHATASAYLPLVEFLKGYFQIGAEDDDATRNEKIRQTVARLGSDLSDTVPYIESVLGTAGAHDPLRQMDPAVKQQRTFVAIRRLLGRQSRQRPLVVLFEDLHWLDSSTEALLDSLIEDVAEAPILLLVNYRPSYHPTWLGAAHCTEIRLQPLAEQSANEMLSSLLGDSPELSALTRLIIDKAQGNPFFMQEIVQTLLDRGVLTRNGTVRLTKPIAEIGIPTTVQAVLASRIDGLPPAHKELLQTLAVIGKEFSLRMVERTTALSPAAVAGMLEDLRVGEFILEVGAPPNLTYSFKHALTQEVTYRSLLSERRALLHGRAGAALEELFGAHLEDHLAGLARHFSLSTDAAKAIHYLRLAGEQASRRSANAEALALLGTALDRLAKEPDGPDRARRELEIIVVISAVLIASKGYAAPELEAEFERMFRLCEQIEDPLLLFFVRVQAWAFASVRGEHVPKACELAQSVMTAAQQLAHPTLQVWAHVVCGNTDYHMGRMSSAREHLEQALALYDPHAEQASGAFQDPGVLAGAYMAPVLWFLGYPDRALTAGRAAIQVARDKKDPFGEAHATFFTASVLHLRGEVEATLRLCDDTIALSSEHGFPIWLGQGQMWRGWALCALGDTQRGIDQLATGIATYAGTGARLGVTYWAGLRAETYLMAGEVERALAAASEVPDLVARGGEGIYEAELYRLIGEATLRRDPADRAAASAAFRKAIQISRLQGTKSWELRAVTSLAQVLDSEGRRSEARAMLEETLGWFTEGFATADLKRAQALLRELS
ncbi:MAG TPA: adenylate/guanylate cyclase domain-containing protein [Candidatus Margulisiibacteriota bacterium]|nr:adenylate/guanylate cyclase domain-containing protein [Candidatus Margulisiibacteriota bacterium]